MADIKYIEELERETALYTKLFNKFFDMYADMFGFDNAIDYLIDLGVTNEEFDIIGFDKEDVARAFERADKE